MLRKVLFGLVLGLCLGSVPAFGQPKDDPAKAQALYEEAERYYKLAEFDAALKLYRESYLASGEPELLFNIGQCNRQLKNYEDALKNYKAYLRDVPSSPSRPEVEKLIKDVESKMGPQPTSEPMSKPASLASTQPTSAKKPAIVKPKAPKLTLTKVWKESTLAKIGSFGAGASFIVGGISLAVAGDAKKSASEDLLLVTEKQSKAKLIAFGADLLFVGGVACVAYGWFQQSQKNKTSLAFQLAPQGGSVALLMEF
jgi:tetratricopeptide (TPR) repeat protein